MKLYTPNGGTLGEFYEASPDDIIAAFNALPGSVRVREAAKVVEAFSHPPNVYTHNERVSHLDVAANLRAIADRLEREDAEKAAHDQEVEELAQLIRSATGLLGSWDAIVESAREEYREQARAVLKAGYRKQADK